MHEWIVCDGCAVFQSPFMMKTMWKSDHEHPLHLALFLVLHKSSTVSVVFDFNASLNDAAPAFPILFSVDMLRMKKSELLMDATFVLFLFFFFVHHSDQVL